jgi:hypothetical protein
MIQFREQFFMFIIDEGSVHASPAAQFFDILRLFFLKNGEAREHITFA